MEAEMAGMETASASKVAALDTSNVSNVIGTKIGQFLVHGKLSFKFERPALQKKPPPPSPTFLVVILFKQKTAITITFRLPGRFKFSQTPSPPFDPTNTTEICTDSLPLYIFTRKFRVHFIFIHTTEIFT